MATIDQRRALDLVMGLMAIRGGSCEESLVAEFVVEKLRNAGVSEKAIYFDTAHRKTPRPGQVGNLIVKLPGTFRGPRVMLSAHLDTVPICVGCQPKREGQKIVSKNSATGLGGDDRAGVAAILNAALEVLDHKLPCLPTTLCFFVQEEIGLQGSRNLSVPRLGNPQYAFNFDGGSPAKLTVGATGGERMKIILHGLAAHAGLAPQEGASAMEAAGVAIADLRRRGWLGSVQKKSKSGTSNIGVIHGGSATNVVCDRVEIDAEARSHDGSFRDEIATAICGAFTAACQGVVSAGGTAVRAEIARRVDYESFRLQPEEKVVQLAKAAVTTCGQEPILSISNGGVDANWLVKHGIPTVTLGCGQRDVHTTSESLDIPDFLTACRVAKQLICQDKE